MKRILFFIFSIPSFLFSARGCLDNSWHMSRAFDNKQYHPVASYYGNEKTHCLCPCRKVTNERGYCPDCGHYRELQPWVIVRSSKS